MADVFAIVPPDSEKNFPGVRPYGRDDQGNALYHFKPAGRKATDEAMDEIEAGGGTPTLSPPEPKK